MSSTNNSPETSQDASASGGSDDLASQLAGGESEFVVSSEEKKPATQQLMYLVLVVAIAGGGMYYMYKRQGPASAAAAPPPEVQKAEQTINTFLTSGPDGIKMMHSMLKDTEKVVKQFLDYPSLNQIPLSSLHTNPFRFAAAGPDGKTATPSEEALKKKREEEKQAATRACDSLKLQSIISGSRKACMINGSLYQEGQVVEVSGVEFTVEKIEPARVVVKTGTYRFELKSKR
jgi:hypothetical protein